MRITEPLAFGAACTLGLLLFLCVPATAGTVRGTVQFPDEVKGGDLRHGGYWRVPNGVLPIGPPLHDVRSEAVVVLVPVGAIDVAASDGQRRAEIRLAGLRMSPQVTVVSPGAQVTLHNDDRVLHRLSCSGAAPLPEQSIPTGGRGTLTLQKAGDYQLLSEDIAHLFGSILVIDGGLYGRVEASGAFQLDAPKGRYQAKLYWRGAWVGEAPVDVSEGGAELHLKAALPRAEKTKPQGGAAPRPGGRAS